MFDCLSMWNVQVDELLHVGDFLRGALMGESAITVGGRRLKGKCENSTVWNEC